jgi:hypothetical protein
MEFRDRDDQYYTGAFADIIQNSTSLQTIIPVGVPQGGGVLRCTETRFRENVLVSGSNESGWLPVVLVVTWRPRGGRPELWLQLRTADNCHREWNRLAHLSSYIFQDDILAGGGGPPGDTAEFDLSEAMVAAAARRCLRMEIDEKPQQVLAPVSSRGYVYPDKENLFFYIFSVELPSHREFPQEAEMRQAPIRTLLTIREGQAVRSALRLCKQKRRPKPIPRAAAEIAALNLTLHGHRDLADDLQTAANQRTGLDRLSRRIAQLDDQIREARRGEDGDVQVAGLAGFQYREFFTMLLPLYADIGVDGASDALAIVREDRVRREAMSRLAALYADENAMATVPSTYGM